MLYYRAVVAIEKDNNDVRDENRLYDVAWSQPRVSRRQIDFARDGTSGVENPLGRSAFGRVSAIDCIARIQFRSALTRIGLLTFETPMRHAGIASCVRLVEPFFLRLPA